VVVRPGAYCTKCRDVSARRPDPGEPCRCCKAVEGEPERPTCPECGPGEALEGQYLVDASEARGEFDGWLCSNCRGFWTVAELDATSAYRQGVIDGDAVAERVRQEVERREGEALDVSGSGAKLVILLDNLLNFCALAEVVLAPADARRGAAYCRAQATDDATRALWVAAADILEGIAEGGDR
jgi:hypothetical protein